MSDEISNEQTYEGESGFKDDYDATITEAWFATDSNYNAGKTTLLFIRQQPDDQDEQIEDRYACGNQWESFDGGETVEHPDGKKRFNQASQVQKFITAAVEAGALDAMKNRGPATQANIWQGLRFHFLRETQSYSFKDRETGELREGERSILLPSKFLGTIDEAIEAEKQPPAESEIPDAVREKLAAIAAEVETHEQFMDRAMELTEVTSDTKLVMAIAEPDGIWKGLK